MGTIVKVAVICFTAGFSCMMGMYAAQKTVEIASDSTKVEPIS